MQLDIVVGFFIFGAISQLLRSDLRLPETLYKSCTIFLLLAIGLKGGYALAQSEWQEVIGKSALIIIFGALLPLLAYPLLRFIGGLPKVDAAATAAHYGSVSVATYAVAVALAESINLEYEPYLPLFVALLEVPAIFTGILLAKPNFWGDKNRSEILHEIFLNQGVVLLIGGIILGAWAGDRIDRVMPFFGELFHGILALFLLEMGRQAATRIDAIKRYGLFLTTFGVFMPLVGAGLAWALAQFINLSAGGTFLLMVLGSSASYIAVPAAMKSALPDADAGLSITASLAITFPFNVLVAIPVYLALAMRDII